MLDNNLGRVTSFELKSIDILESKQYGEKIVVTFNVKRTKKVAEDKVVILETEDKKYLIAGYHSKSTGLI